MKAMWIRKAAFIIASALMLVIFIKMNGSITSFIGHVQEQDAVYTFMKPVKTSEEKEQLYNQIVEEAKEKREEPVNARIDRVFHAIPGYNGIAVDIEATYESNVDKMRGDKLTWVFKEIEPDIGLEQLGAHPIYKGNANKPMVSLMINVAWGDEYLPGIMRALAEENVKVTFFLDGTWLRDHKETALQMKEAGHELSNHAYSHPDMSKLSRSAQYSQIEKTEALLKELDIQNKWFAPPSGDFNTTTIQVAREQGLMTVLWTLDTVDWRRPPAHMIMKRIEGKLEPGALILMHPTSPIEEVLPQMIKYIKSQGYSLGTVTDTLSSSRYKPVVEGVDLF